MPEPDLCDDGSDQSCQGDLDTGCISPLHVPAMHCCVYGGLPALRTRYLCDVIHALDPAEGTILDAAQCTEACCSTLPGTVTRYACEQAGGTVQNCPGGPS
ncbi:MAG: hypothetical protein FJ104_05290 [Deltaproteobacteria bacterium]|nr:hypothetical protein [Deltaproteobacteria bacterium]